MKKQILEPAKNTYYRSVDWLSQQLMSSAYTTYETPIYTQLLGGCIGGAYGVMRQA